MAGGGAVPKDADPTPARCWSRSGSINDYGIGTTLEKLKQAAEH
jgi:hypothetical protein